MSKTETKADFFFFEKLVLHVFTYIHVYGGVNVVPIATLDICSFKFELTSKNSHF